MTEPRYPRTNAGKELWRLAEAVAVKLEPDGGGPFVDVAVMAVQLIREQVIAIEDEADQAHGPVKRNTTHECPICGHVHLPIEPATTPEASDSPEKP